MPQPRSLFVTGASGYVGRSLLQRIDARRFGRVVCLVRRPEMLASLVQEGDGIEFVAGDLLEPGRYLDKLSECDAVVHLAAVTGKAKPAMYFRGNAEGTRTLVEAYQSAGVRNFLHVSTIAVKFADQTRYHYAHSKQRAEEIVVESGLSYTIVRPTIVIGPGAPVLEGLSRMAGGPLMPVFGDGRAAVQPVFVDDLIDCMLAILGERRFRGETIEIGGPEVMSIEEFLNRIRAVRFGRQPRAVHLPLTPIRCVLGLFERFLLPIMPLTAGQLAVFANDGTIEPNPVFEQHRNRMKDVDDVLRMVATHA